MPWMDGWMGRLTLAAVVRFTAVSCRIEFVVGWAIHNSQTPQLFIY